MPRQRAPLDWLRIDRTSAVSLQEQVTRQLRDAIGDGRLSSGTPLPSSRELAAELAVARGTISAVYDRLVGERLLEVRSRSTTFIADALPARSAAEPPPRRQSPSLRRAPQRGSVENPLPSPAFLTGVPAFDFFPAMRWARLLSRRAQQMPQELADNDFHVGGYRPLKAELARYLKTARGVDCEPDQIVIATSARAALSAICQVLATPGEGCIVEDPGYPIARRIFADFGLDILPLPVDADGINIDAGVPAARLAYLTPTYQMPLGVRLADRRCRALVEWAERQDAWLVEDDYDSEFRYAGEAIAALQGSDPNGRVIHIGTFSKTLFPSLRAAYLVVPKALAQPTVEIIFLHGREPSLHLQAALFDFIQGGHYAAHIRRARTVYRRRQKLLVEALNRHAGDIVEIAGPAGGMHVLLPLPPDISADAVQDAAAREALHARAISYFAVEARAPNALLLGYAAVPDRLIEPAAERLGRVIRALRSGPN